MAKRDNTILWIIGAGVLAAIFVFGSNANASPVINPSGLDALSQFPGLAQNFAVSMDSANRINALLAEMESRGYSMLQIELMLSQILHESGMLTPVANYGLMNQNNYAGLTTTAGGYASYNSISDFMDAYDGFLTKGSDPLAATSLQDFNNRLVANRYYTDNPATYLADMQQYFNALNQ